MKPIAREQKFRIHIQESTNNRDVTIHGWLFYTEHPANHHCIDSDWDYRGYNEFDKVVIELILGEDGEEYEELTAYEELKMMQYFDNTYGF